MSDPTPTQAASAELAAAVFADPALRSRFELMAKEATAREPVPDDFEWLERDGSPSQGFSRFKELTRKLLAVAKDEATEQPSTPAASQSKRHR